MYEDKMYPREVQFTNIIKLIQLSHTAYQRIEFQVKLLQSSGTNFNRFILFETNLNNKIKLNIQSSKFSVDFLKPHKQEPMWFNVYL